MTEKNLARASLVRTGRIKQFMHEAGGFSSQQSMLRTQTQHTVLVPIIQWHRNATLKASLGGVARHTAWLARGGATHQ